MTVAQLLPLLTQATVILVTLITLYDFLRYRDQPRFDVFLMFGDLALIVVTQLINLALEPDLPWLGVLSSILLMAHPYLLLRLVQHLRPISSPVRSFAIIGLILSWLGILLLGSPTPPTAAVLMVVYFAIVEGYAVAAIIQGAMVTSGVTHWRLLLAAIGSGLIGAVILIAGLTAVLPSAASTLSPISQVIGLLSLLCYFFGFATPAWLRRYWQLSELHRFLIQGSGRAWTGEQTGEALRSYCQAAERAVGGSGALVLLWDQDEKQLNVRASSPQGEGINRSQINYLTLERIWREGKSKVLRIPDDYQPAELTSSPPETARALLAVLIATRERSWGLLVVYLLRAPIFASDDLALLDLFSEQVGAALDYGTLLVSLEQRVADRTKQLQEAVDNLEQEIAARKEAEGAVQKLNEDLQHRALELKAANKELEAFAYSVSHDLRAPLRAIDGFSRVLMTKFASNLEGDALRYLGLVRENTHQMGELIDDLLAFSRLSRQSLNKQVVDPGELVRIALHDLLNDQGDRAIEMVIGDLPPLIADPNLLRQVFVNLLSNAIKYSSHRDRQRIEVGCFERDGERVYFVKDNGVGFDMQYADKLFGVFQRLHPADEFEGTGVGLAIIHRIITRHGGRVWAEAEVDQGATFYFTLGKTEPQQLTEASPVG